MSSIPDGKARIFEPESGGTSRGLKSSLTRIAKREGLRVIIRRGRIDGREVLYAQQSGE